MMMQNLALTLVNTRKHSSRMHTVHALVSPPDVSTGEGGPQMNKFEQVSSDGHKMSQGGMAGRVPCLMSGLGPGGPLSDVGGEGAGAGVTFPQLRWRVVKIYKALPSQFLPTSYIVPFLSVLVLALWEGLLSKNVIKQL